MFKDINVWIMNKTQFNKKKRRKTKFLEWNDDLVQCTKFQSKIRLLIYLQLYTTRNVKIRQDSFGKEEFFES